MAISLTKKIPNTGFGYGSGGGLVTVTLNGVTEITYSIKKTLIKLQYPKGKATQTGNINETPDTRIFDFKRSIEQITIKGWLEDDLSETAWKKLWKLRAMITSGQGLSVFTWDNLTWKGEGGSTDTNCPNSANLEEVTVSIRPTDIIGINNYSQGKGGNPPISPYNLTGIGRIEVTISIVFGKIK